MTPATEFEALLGPLDEATRNLAVENFTRAAGNGSGIFQDRTFRLTAMRTCISEASGAVARMRETPRMQAVRTDAPKGSDLQLVPYSRIPRKRVSCLWTGFIPFGKHVLLEGDPDVGKSTLTIDLAARVTTGANMPDRTPGCEPGGVLILSAEDDPEDTIGPRLMAAGADLERVHHARFTLAGIEREPTICEADIAQIEKAVRDHGIKLVVIDPMTAYLDGSVRVYVDHDVRRALLPLKRLAERTGIALLVIRHWTKAPNLSAQHRGGGSIGITAAARGVLSVGFDPDDQNPDQNKRKRVLSVAKLNVGARGIPREFHLEYMAEHGACCIVWGGESRHTADTLSAGPGAQNGSAMEDAKDFLLERVPFLATALTKAGPRLGLPVKALQDEAREADIALITLRRARKELGWGAFTGVDGPPWFWGPKQGNHMRTDDHLPTKDIPEDDHLRESGRLPGLGDAAEPEGRQS